MRAVPPGRRRKHVLHLEALAVGLVLLAGATTPALAHGDDGAMDVLSSKQAGPNSIYLEVSIPYANDSELASAATVTATLSGPEDEVIRDVALTLTPRTSYAGEIRVPRAGTWLVSMASENPVAEATVEVQVVDADGRASETRSRGTGALLLVALGVAGAVGAAAVLQRRRAWRSRS